MAYLFCAGRRPVVRFSCGFGLKNELVSLGVKNGEGNSFKFYTMQKYRSLSCVPLPILQNYLFPIIFEIEAIAFKPKILRHCV